VFAVFIHRCLGRGGAVVSRRKTEHTDLQYPVSSDVSTTAAVEEATCFSGFTERKEAKRIETCSVPSVAWASGGPVAERAIATSNNTQ
jgi:hypothetical protein